MNDSFKMVEFNEVGLCSPIETASSMSEYSDSTNSGKLVWIILLVIILLALVYTIYTHSIQKNKSNQNE